MAANLTADYLAAEQAYKRAHTHEERLAALEEMLATVPKHKGTEKIQAELKRRLSQVRKESEKKTAGGSIPKPLARNPTWRCPTCYGAAQRYRTLLRMCIAISRNT